MKSFKLSTNNKNNEEVKLTTARVFAYIFGVIFLISGIVNLFSQFIAGILFVLVSIFILPSFYSLLRTKTKISLSRNLRIIIAIVLIVLAGVSINSSDIKNDKTVVEQEPVKKEKAEEVQVKNEPVEKAVVEEPIKQAKPELAPAPKVETQNQPTLGERQALSSAKSYLNYTGFSRKGLIEQLEFEGFTNKEAVYGVDNSNANWNQQAAISAKNYMEYSAFSRSGLIEQLVFEGYTQQQAEYGAQSVGY